MSIWFHKPNFPGASMSNENLRQSAPTVMLTSDVTDGQHNNGNAATINNALFISLSNESIIAHHFSNASY